ncbi:MAG: hypothetical protein H6739_13770 [Alphaproteobacteria bacterium]|nr:hypothetical protein [Alphaproteobacteria bacterium]
MSPSVTSLGVEQVILCQGAALLVDCGDGVYARWLEEGLPAEGPEAVLFTDGTPERIGGLYAFLSGLRRAGRSRPLRLIHLLTEDRIGGLLAAFVTAEGADFPVEVDAELPGAWLSIGPFAVQLRPAPLGVGYRISVLGETLELRAGHEA